MKRIQNFLGFANFYRRFIKNFSNYNITSNDHLERLVIPIKKEQNDIFEKLKKLFTTILVLAQFNPDKEIILEINTSR
jgi:hypothetical protein